MFSVSDVVDVFGNGEITLMFSVSDVVNVFGSGEITLMFSGHRLCVWFGVTRTLVVMKNAPFSAGGTT